jgi:hypothetical protein
LSGRLAVLVLILALVTLAVAGWTVQALLWAPRRTVAAGRARAFASRPTVLS